MSFVLHLRCYFAVLFTFEIGRICLPEKKHFEGVDYRQNDQHGQTRPLTIKPVAHRKIQEAKLSLG